MHLGGAAEAPEGHIHLHKSREDLCGRLSRPEPADPSRKERLGLEVKCN